MAEKKRLGEILIEAGLIDKLQLDSALGHQRNWGGRLGSILIELGFIDERDLAGVMENQLNLPCINISSLEIPKSVLDSVKVEIVKKYSVFPVDLKGNTITLTMMDPTDLRLIDELQFVLGKRIIPALALESEIKRAIRKYYEGEEVGGRLYKAEMRKGDTKIEFTSDVLTPSEEVAPRPTGEEAKKTEEAKKEIPLKVIVEAMASLLIEKGIIKRDDLLERIKKQIKQ